MAPTAAGPAPLRILVISNCPLDPSQGSGYVITGYAQRMRERGHQVVAFGIEHFTPFQGMRRLTRIRRLLGYAFTAQRHARSSAYDIVELWGAEGWLALLCLRLMRQSRPVPVSRSNGLETQWHQLQPLAAPRWLSKLQRFVHELPEIAFRGCAALTVVSQFDASFSHDRAYQPESRLLVLENPLDTSWLAQSPRFERQPVIGFVGTWLPRKGSALLPEAMRLVLLQVPTAHFLLIGVGNEGQAAIAQLLPNEMRIETIAFCPRDQLMAHYHRMAVLVMPSSYESFGLVAAEAMACGAALAATRTGFAAGLGGDEFAAIEELSSVGIARALTLLLGDETRRRSMARAGHARVQSLDWARATDELEGLYRRLLSPDAQSSLSLRHARRS